MKNFILAERICSHKLDLFNSHNINFLVFGRKIKSNFIDLGSVDIPPHVSDRFIGFDEEIFRDDISSTDIRRDLN